MFLSVPASARAPAGIWGDFRTRTAPWLPTGGDWVELRKTPRRASASSESGSPGQQVQATGPEGPHVPRRSLVGRARGRRPGAARTAARRPGAPGAAATGGAKRPLTAVASSAPSSPFFPAPSPPPPPRRSWRRPAAGWSRHRSRSTAAATWCRGRSTASSPSSSSTSGACRSARRCGRAWPRAAGSGRGGLGVGNSSGAWRVGARTRRGMARHPAGSPGFQPSALLSFLVARWLHHSRPELSPVPETHLWGQCVPGAPSLFFSSLRDIWSARWGTGDPCGLLVKVWLRRVEK